MSYGLIFLVVFLGLLGALAVAHGVKWLVDRSNEHKFMLSVVQQIVRNDQAAQQAALEKGKKAKP